MEVGEESLRAGSPDAADPRPKTLHDGWQITLMMMMMMIVVVVVVAVVCEGVPVSSVCV
jgi:hypothetical protein